MKQARVGFYYFWYNSCIFLFIEFIFSGLKIKFQIDINEITYLAEQQSSLEDLLYLESHFCEDENKKEKLFDSVYLKAICESQPEYRLVTPYVF